MPRRRKPALQAAFMLLLLVSISAISPSDAFAQDEEAPSLPETAPVPVERPDDEDEGPEPPAEDVEAGDETSGAAEEDDESGSQGSDPADAEGDDETSEDDESEAETEPEPEPEPSPPQAEDPAGLRACRAALRDLGATFQRLDPILPQGMDEDGCGVSVPFAVTQILPGITLEPATEMRCEVALNLARWVKQEVLPAAEALELGPLIALDHGSTYVCRPRNNVEDAKLSEHAKGNAIDIMSFRFEAGETISVSPKEGDGDAAEAFQKAVGSGACLYFTTVLGPGSDPYHDDHLHLDLAERNGGWRMCQAP
jgi:hypothetical protein